MWLTMYWWTMWLWVVTGTDLTSSCGSRNKNCPLPPAHSRKLLNMFNPIQPTPKRLRLTYKCEPLDATLSIMRIQASGGENGRSHLADATMYGDGYINVEVPKFFDLFAGNIYKVTLVPTRNYAGRGLRMKHKRHATHNFARYYDLHDFHDAG